MDALVAWEAMNWDGKNRKQKILDYAHSKGAKILLSVGGAEDHIDEAGGPIETRSGREYGRMAAQAVLDHNFDGLDYDLELLPGHHIPFYSGDFIQFLRDTHEVAREMLPQSQGYRMLKRTGGGKS